MKRLIILILFLLGVTISVFANNIQTKSNTKTFLYLYIPDCSYCVKFEPIFIKVSEAFAGKCNFKKVDARTKEGQKLMQKYNGFFVPYVLILDNKTDYKAYISPNCILSYACTSSAVDKFINE